jgi:DNA polymerase alpha subunit B
MSDTTIKKLLMQRSTVYKDISPNVVRELAKISKDIDVESKKIVGMFDKFVAISRQSSASVTMDDVEAFAKEQAVLLNKARAGNVFAAKTDWEDMDISKNSISSIIKDGESLRTPVQAQPALGGASTVTKISPYLSRTPAELSERRSGRFESHNGTVQTALNGDMMFERHTDGEVDDLDAPKDGSRESLKALNSLPTSTYMMNTLLSRVQYLDDRIRTMEDAIDAQIHPKRTRSIASACQDLAVFCGRIVCDTEGGRLNPQSVMLEGSIATSRGARVRLDLQSCGDYRLFPGQIVAVVGKNPTGFCIVAQDIVSGLPFPEEPLDTTAEDSNSFDMVVAVGPFTPTDSLLYEPLKAVIEYCEREKPDTLLLVGPFVDQDHPSISDGMLDATFEDVFSLKVAEEIEKLQERTNIKVALQPSIRDVHHDVAFPQKPLEMPEDSKVESLPNPTTLKYNGTTMGCSSVDWLMSCTKEEISKTSGKKVDRLSALACHVVQQQSFYPMYPSSASVPLDVTKPDAFEDVGVPEILLTPSDLAPFAKQATLSDQRVDLDDENDPVKTVSSRTVICVNPGRVTKGATAGTFAHIYVNPKVSGAIEARCKVEIKKV